MAAPEPPRRHTAVPEERAERLRGRRVLLPVGPVPRAPAPRHPAGAPVVQARFAHGAHGVHDHAGQDPLRAGAPRGGPRDAEALGGAQRRRRRPRGLPGAVVPGRAQPQGRRDPQRGALVEAVGRERRRGRHDAPVAGLCRGRGRHPPGHHARDALAPRRRRARPPRGDPRGHVALPRPAAGGEEVDPTHGAAWLGMRAPW
mmetsp:Transcript_105431/g.298424  ORF Transcript_105431/g.298424 Transcript_105431/m.298424 type:complete len:201 (-) Transcript_105431:27-629(-)